MPESSQMMDQLMNRASLRDFSDRPVEPETLDQILSASVNGPSGGNLQPYSIIVIEDDERRKHIAEMCFQGFIAKAPVLLLYCLDLHRNELLADHGIAPYTARYSFRHFWISVQDTMCAAQNGCTAADALGLGSCYIGTVLEYFTELAEIFSLPRGVLPVELVCLGYPASEQKVRPKFPVSIMAHRGEYHEPEIDALVAAYDEREQGRTYRPTVKNLEQLVGAARNVGGDGLAVVVEKSIEEAGAISPIQHRFGLHYRADEMPTGNLDFIRKIEDRGFFCFRSYEDRDDWESEVRT